MRSPTGAGHWQYKDLPLKDRRALEKRKDRKDRKELEGKRAKLWLCDLNKCWVNKAEHEISCWLGHEWLGDKSSAQKRPVS